ncbi:hypothetical protein JCM8202_006195 [Rhodotorula sphaerocarpa]
MKNEEHTIQIKNSPLLGSSLLITNFAGLTKEGGDGTTSIGPPGMTTIPLPTPDAAYTSSILAQASKADGSLRSSFASESSASLVSHISESLLAAKVTATAASTSASAAETRGATNTLATTVTTGPTTSASAVLDPSSFTTTGFILISATVLAIIVVALLVAMCWNTKPKRRPPEDVVERRLGSYARAPRRKRRACLLISDLLGHD